MGEVAVREIGISLIDNINVQQIENTMKKITQFQGLVQRNLKQNHDFGVIPGTPKPSLLKPGAEKILMLMGITSEYELTEKVQDYENGFFAFTVKCTLSKNDVKITEGMGHCNNKEKKWIKQDPYTVANTCLKMAKKRAQIDAVLTIASLSEIFTQDIEDMDLNGTGIEESNKKVATDDGTLITEGQRKRLFAIAKGNNDLIKTVLKKYGYESSNAVTKMDYDDIVKEVESGGIKKVETDEDGFPKFE